MSARDNRSAAAAGSGLACALALLALSASSPAHAQVVAQGALERPDPWGLGWIGRADGALDQGLWSATTRSELETVFKAVEAGSLSPAGLAVVRRVMLSGARPPENAGDLVTARIDLLEQVGDSERANDLRRQFPETPWGATWESTATELQLALGRSSTACGRVASVDPGDAAWMHARVLCFALAGDLNAASAIAELALTPEGTPDTWLIAAMEALREPTRTRPEAKFGTPFEAAVSITARLAPGAGAPSVRPDIAAMVIRHPEAGIDLKRAVVSAAVDHARIAPEDARAVLNAAAADPASSAARRPARGLDAAALLSSAVAAANDQKLAPAAQAAAFAAALKAASSASEFRLAAYALKADMADLVQVAEAAAFAETFARAALMAGDTVLAGQWRTVMTAAETPDDWAVARLDLMLALASGGDAGRGEVIDRLIAATPAAGPAPRGNAPPSQAALRRIETTRALFLASGLGLPMSPAARAQLSGERTTGRGVSDGALGRIESAITAGATGEAALAAAALLQSDPSAMSFAGLADLLNALTRVGVDQQADALMLEAMQPWKAI
ncbi:hypothetical protein GC169_03570 [bacterium]|nr:hypothetical protein [bacterium]